MREPSLRYFYPKTDVPKPTKSAPEGFRSIDETYTWASRFLKRVATCFGSEWIHKRLSAWKWGMTTAFSGVGCAESVAAPAIARKNHAYISFILNCCLSISSLTFLAFCSKFMTYQIITTFCSNVFLRPPSP